MRLEKNIPPLYAPNDCYFYKEDGSIIGLYITYHYYSQVLSHKGNMLNEMPIGKWFDLFNDIKNSYVL